MHPFNFTFTISFICEEPDSSLVFEPQKNYQFHWYGKKLDKLGNYEIVQTDKLYLELEWNYGREQTYLVVSNEGLGDTMISFVLQNITTGQLYSFNR